MIENTFVPDLSVFINNYCSVEDVLHECDDYQRSIAESIQNLKVQVNSLSQKSKDVSKHYGNIKKDIPLRSEEIINKVKQITEEMF